MADNTHRSLGDSSICYYFADRFAMPTQPYQPSRKTGGGVVGEVTNTWLDEVKARLEAAKVPYALCQKLKLIWSDEATGLTGGDVHKALSILFSDDLASLKKDLAKVIRIIQVYGKTLAKYKFKLENAGAYIVEDRFEEPWHCELLRYVHEGLAEAETIKGEP